MSDVRPRLLCLLHLPPPIHGAAVVGEQVVNSARLADAFDVEILPLRFADSAAEIERITLSKLSRAAKIAFRLTAKLAWHRPDGVYFTISTNGGSFLRDCAYVALIRAFGVPRVYHLHAKGVGTGRRWTRALQRWCFDGARVIHLSPLLAPDLDGLVDKEQLVFVGNGIADHEPAAAARVARGPLRLLFLSNIVETKGPFVLLDALQRLRARGVEVTATFAGASGHDACFARFEREVAALTSHARYVGAVYGEEKERLFADHDAFVLPTLRDAFSLVVLEAMQARLPVVTTIEGAMPEIVEDGVTGYLVARGDPEALADKIAVLASDRGHARRMGEAGRARYLERFTAERFEENLVAALRDYVVPKRRAR